MRLKKLSKPNYLPQEFDIGNLLNNDEIFNLIRPKLRPETYLDDKLQKLVRIMIDHGNSIDAILKICKDSASYALELANHAASWTIQLRNEKFKEEKIEKKEPIDYEELVRMSLTDEEKQYANGECFKFLCSQLQRFLEDKGHFEDNRQSLRMAKENFDNYLIICRGQPGRLDA